MSVCGLAILTPGATVLTQNEGDQRAQHAAVAAQSSEDGSGHPRPSGDPEEGRRSDQAQTAEKGR